MSIKLELNLFFSTFITFITYCGTATELEISKTYILFAVNVKTEQLAENCLYFHCFYLQKHSCAIYRFCFNSYIRDITCGCIASSSRTGFKNCIVLISNHFFQAVSYCFIALNVVYIFNMN